ncbi:MAG: hypothetical protein HFK09_00035 [Clostridia bacterium]|nr:hypothetical protein [Clostridia bacterium]
MEFKIYTMAEIRAIPISDLREFAKEIGVRAPTTFTKEALENAVFDKLQEIDNKRKTPAELMSPHSRAGIINKALVPDDERSKYGPFKQLPKHAAVEKFIGWFRPYSGGDGIVSRKFLPKEDDLFISQDFVLGAKLEMGDKLEGDYIAGKDGAPGVVAHLLKVNGRQITEHRAANVFHTERKRPSRLMEIWSADHALRSFALAAPVAYGSRIFLSHGSDCSLTDFSLKLACSLEEKNLEVLALFLNALPEREAEIDSLKGASACAFDVPEKCARYAAEMICEAALRMAEEGKDVALVIDNLEAVGNFDLVRRLLGCACALEKGSVTVFASANDDIMDRRAFKTAESVSDAVVRFKAVRGDVVVDFKQSFIKCGGMDWSLLDRLREIDGEAVSAIVRNCATREQAESVLK